MKKLFILLMLSVVSRAYAALVWNTADYPKYETRGVWLTTLGGLDWPKVYANTPAKAEQQKQELREILDRLARANVNTVLFQTRLRATTVYPSAMEPWASCLTGQHGVSPGYDPLRFAVDECHKRGMEIHAWIVTVPVGKWESEGCKALRKKYPRLMKKIGDEGYMNPEMAQTGDHIAKICAEVTANYDIDGIHLDYIRYPETWPRIANRSKARQNITDIVRKINASVKRLKPWVKLTCSPVGKRDDLRRYSSKGWNAYNRVCQDADGWMRDGLIDGVFPMLYFRDNNFYPFAVDWQERSGGRTVSAGLGIYQLHPAERDWEIEEVRRQILTARSHGVGHTYFRSQFFTDNTKGIYDLVVNELDAYPALVPPMTWASTDRPDKPSQLVFDDSGDKDVLLWQAEAPCSLLYNIYGSDTYPVDISKAENILALRRSGNRMEIPKGMRRYYAVTAMNRYGIESEAAQSGESLNGMKDAYRQAIKALNQKIESMPKAASQPKAPDKDKTKRKKKKSKT